MIVIPVVLSGGAGSRLWPVSREGHPKPFMKLPDGETLIEKTYKRAAKLSQVYQENGKAKILTVTNRDYYFMSRDELEKSGATGTFLLEPFGRNTAPAIALAAHRVRERFGDEAIMLVLSADHLIQDDAAFADAVERAVQLATKGFLVTFGIVPTGPETGFGYIKAGDKIEGFGNHVESFVEKPDLETAQGYVDSGICLWNAGMFCFRAGEFLNQLASCDAVLAAACEACWVEVTDNSARDPRMIEIPEKAFGSVQDVSIDYAVMEKAGRVAVVPGKFGWNDIGSWGAMKELIAPDAMNNRASGNAIFVNSKNTYIQSEDRLVAAVGVEGLMVIDTKDALLVATEGRAQDVKSVVKILKDSGSDLFKTHRTVARPWGTYTVLEQGRGFKIKRIEVKPGASLSLQMHHHRSEHWVVVVGEATVVNGENEIKIRGNESTYIPAGQKHRLENQTDEDLIMIEVQCGTYLGEDDIVRFQDTYGRVA